MCGIAGQFIQDPERSIDPSRIVPMAASIRHRGPDEWGYYIGCRQKGLLINTRLSIVDLSNGKQPLCNEDGSIWVVLNGELYGFAEMAADLIRRGHRFRTRSDTEVIVHLYEEYGESFVGHLRGEYAIALLDERRECLYLVRDRFGIKPLFYARPAGSVVFGSEIKAVFQQRDVPRRLDRRSIFFALHGFLAPGTTPFEGVHALEPGCLLRVSQGQVMQERYWDLPIADEGQTRLDEREAIDEFRRLFHDAVRVRLHGDVEVGAYVSGGLDSMSVAGAAAEFSSRRLKVFTVSFRDRALDEGPAAVQFAREHGFEHHVLDVGHGDLAPHFERSLWHSEILVHNSHGAAKLILSGLARRHVKVVLTGEGADEALAGYAAFRHTQLLGALRDSPSDARLRAEVERLQHEMRGGLSVLNSGILPIREYPQYDRVVELFGAYPYGAARAIDALGNTHRVLSNDLLNETGHLDLLDEMARQIGYGRMAGLSPVGAHQYYVFKTDLPAYILCYLGDRVEMANSIEGRVPLLDHPLVEFAFRLPVSLKLRDGQGKYILRRAVHERLPEVTGVKKRPFIAPSADTLGFSRRSGALGRYLDPGTFADVGIFDPAAIGWMRRVLPWLPRGSRWRALGETALTAVVSLHALHEMFCRDFDRSAERFVNPNVKTTLAEGAVSVRGAAGTLG